MTPNTTDALTTNHTADALLPCANITIDHPIIQFLLGESEYCGIWFGDDRPGYGAFWWRTPLRQTFSKHSNTNHAMTVWMIEWPASDNMPTRWWNPRDGWMLDPNKGMRFSRKEDAEMLIQSEARRGFVSGVLPTEHKWIDRTHPTAATPASEGCNLIAQERQRQIEKEGWTAKHDDTHEESELAKAAAHYVLFASKPKTQRDRERDILGSAALGWPWDREWWKPSLGNTDAGRIRELVKAGALIAAEIDRLKRAAPKPESP